MKRVVLTLLVLITVGFTLPTPVAHAEGSRKELVQRLKERDSWGRSEKAIRHSIIVAKWIAEHRFGWRDGQWNALKALWSHESGFRWWARNGSSGACGIPQFHPCQSPKVRGDFLTNPVTQIRHGSFYIVGNYKTPLNACGGDCQSGTY